MMLSAVIALLSINVAFGAGLEDNHYIDQQHNPGHDVNMLLGNQVV